MLSGYQTIIRNNHYDGAITWESVNDVPSVMVMCRCGFIDRNKCATLVMLTIGEAREYRIYEKSLYLPFKFAVNPKLLLKNKVYFLKKGIKLSAQYDYSRNVRKPRLEGNIGKTYERNLFFEICP